MQKVQFPVGDWSDDGHGRCEYFLVGTAKEVTAIREAHFLAEAEGVDIGRICSEYETAFVDEDILATLDDKGIAYDDLPVEEDMNAQCVARLWIRILNHFDPGLELVEITEEQVPTVTFYGRDDQGRHLRSPGYGVFFD